jgi:hypothetical protein
MVFPLFVALLVLFVALLVLVVALLVLFVALLVLFVPMVEWDALPEAGICAAELSRNERFLAPSRVDTHRNLKT